MVVILLSAGKFNETLALDQSSKINEQINKIGIDNKLL